jgi:hypothetical protein
MMSIAIFVVMCVVFGLIIKSLFFKKSDELVAPKIVPTTPVMPPTVVPASEGLASIMALEAPAEPAPAVAKTAKPKKKYGGKVKKKTPTE